MRTKVTKDGFVWLVISKEAAYQLFSSDIEVFRLYNDDSEGVCDNALIPSRYEGSDFECLECDNEYLASQI